MVNGQIKLAVKVRDAPRRDQVNAEFVVFDSTSPVWRNHGTTSSIRYEGHRIGIHYSIRFSTSCSLGKIKGNKLLKGVMLFIIP